MLCIGHYWIKSYPKFDSMYINLCINKKYDILWKKTRSHIYIITSLAKCLNEKYCSNLFLYSLLIVSSPSLLVASFNASKSQSKTVDPANFLGNRSRYSLLAMRFKLSQSLLSLPSFTLLMGPCGNSWATNVRKRSPKSLNDQKKG